MRRNILEPPRRARGGPRDRFERFVDAFARIAVILIALSFATVLANGAVSASWRNAIDLRDARTLARGTHPGDGRHVS